MKIFRRKCWENLGIAVFLNFQSCNMLGQILYSLNIYAIFLYISFLLTVMLGLCFFCNTHKVGTVHSCTISSFIFCLFLWLSYDELQEIRISFQPRRILICLNIGISFSQPIDLIIKNDGYQNKVFNTLKLENWIWLLHLFTTNNVFFIRTPKSILNFFWWRLKNVLNVLTCM